MQYRIVEAKDAEGLEVEVNAMIAAGWTPVGGVCVISSTNTYAWWFYQAMVSKRDGYESRS